MHKKNSNHENGSNLNYGFDNNYNQHFEFKQTPSKLFDNNLGSRKKRHKILKDTYEYYKAMKIDSNDEFLDDFNFTKFLKFA